MKKHDRDRQLNKEPKEILDEVSEVKETVDEAAEEVTESAEDSVEEIAEAAEESVEEAAEAAEDVAETAEEVVEEVNDLTDKDEVESAFEAEASDDVVLQGAILLETADADADEIPENVPVEDATETFTETSDEESEKIPVSVPVEDPTETFTETSDEEKSEEAESDEETADSEEEKDEEDSDEESDKDEEDAEEESEDDSDDEDEDEDEDEEKDKEESEKEKSALYMFFDTIKFVAIGLLIGILLVVFVVQRNDVYGSSMEPTLHTGDAVFVEMISVYTGNFSRGDIITIDAKGMDGYAHEENLIKRIVGLPGETIKIADGLVYINGELLDESDYLPAGTMTYVGAEGQARGYDEVTLGPDEYYCMGDNRGGSNDSRRMGPFKKSQIDAKVLMRIYPFNKMKFF
ncbi:MAG: signal peptidase I [Clostridiales bacterium]|nr:signal peptidase I [Clostridiales bacterium]